MADNKAPASIELTKLYLAGPWADELMSKAFSLDANKIETMRKSSPNPSDFRSFDPNDFIDNIPSATIITTTSGEQFHVKETPDEIKQKAKGPAFVKLTKVFNDISDDFTGQSLTFNANNIQTMTKAPAAPSDFDGIAVATIVTTASGTAFEIIEKQEEIKKRISAAAKP